MKKNLGYAFLISLLGFVLLFTGCKEKKNEETKLKVGVLLPLTGDLAFLGNVFHNSMLMNVDTTKIQLIVEDTKGEAKTAVNLAQKLISTDKVKIMISFIPAISESVNPVCKANNMTHFVFAFSPEITANENVLKMYPSSNDEAGNYIKYIKENNIKNVVFLRHIFPDAELAFKSIIQPQLKSLNIQVEDIPFDLATKDFKNLASKVKSYNPELIIVQSLSYNYSNILKSFIDANLSNKVLGDLNFIDLYNYSDIIPQEMENIPFLGVDYCLNNPYKIYEENYYKTFKKRPYIFGAFPYDLMTVVNNIDKSGISKNDIINYYNQNTISGVSGEIKFNETGDQIIDYGILKYIDNKVTHQ